MSALLRVLTCAFYSPSENEGPLTRMFRTEYGSEYIDLQKSGVNITDCFVKQFLKDQKSGK